MFGRFLFWLLQITNMSAQMNIKSFIFGTSLRGFDFASLSFHADISQNIIDQQCACDVFAMLLPGITSLCEQLCRIQADRLSLDVQVVVSFKLV